MKCLSIIIFIFCVFGCASSFKKVSNIASGFNVQPDQVLLVVKVNRTEYTGYYPASGCDSEECIPVSFWYTHEAEVIDVIKGKYDSPQISFANLQHADYIDEIKNEWYIQLKAISSKELREQLKVKYYVVKHDSEFQQNTKE